MISLELALAVDLADSGSSDKDIAASLWTDVSAIRELLRQARALGALTGRTAVWPVFADLLQGMEHEPDARHLIEARAAGRSWSPEDAPQEKGHRMKRRKVDAEMLRQALDVSQRIAAGEDGAIARVARAAGLSRSTLVSRLDVLRALGGSSGPEDAAHFAFDRPDVILAKIKDKDILDGGGAADFLQHLVDDPDTGDLFEQPPSEQPEPEPFTSAFTDAEVQALKRMAAREIGAPEPKPGHGTEVARMRVNSDLLAALRDHCERHNIALATALGRAIEFWLAGGAPGGQKKPDSGT